jgi:hypothetical protein
MDRERFDALARLLVTSGSRRAALGALLGVVLLGQDPEALAKRRERKGKGQSGRGGHGGEGVQGEGRPGAAHKKHHRKHGTQRQRRKKRRQQDRRQDQDEGSGDCPPEVCQDAFRDPFGFCVYTDSPDNQPGPGCTAPGRFCCQGSCCRSGDVCRANGCCTPESRETTCAGKCSDVTDNCGQSVDCGTCPAQTCRSVVCNATTHVCDYTVQPNGQPGTDCATQCCNGACCPAGTVCANGACVCTAASCPNGCCSNGPGNPGTCQPDLDTTCGRNGVQCVDCRDHENACVNGTCVCNAASCFVEKCCSNGPGNPGTCEPLTRETCGINGAQCVSCCHGGAGCDICNTSTGQCN